MVLIHCKRGADQEFLYEVPAATPCDDVVRELARIHNKRLRLQRLVLGARDLANHGPSKPEDKQGYDEDEMAEHLKESASVADSNEPQKPGRDPTGRRVGIPPSAELRETILRTAADAEQFVSNRQVEAKVVMTHKDIDRQFDLIRASFTMAYPMGLPEWDPLLATLDDVEDLEGTQASKDVFDPETCLGWFASKELQRDKLLSDIVGKNDKTKIVVKLTRKGSGAPAREAAIDPQTQKEMMSFYHKKAEEQKKLIEDEEDAYLNSPWANPKGLKNAFNGLGGGISYRPF